MCNIICSYLATNIKKREGVFLKLTDIDTGDLIETTNGDIGVITKITRKGVFIETFDGKRKIYLKEIKKIRYIKPKCLRHGIRFCKLCNHYQNERLHELRKLLQFQKKIEYTPSRKLNANQADLIIYDEIHNMQLFRK